MRFRLGETPWGLARFTYAYLAALLAGVIAGLVALIAYPFIDTAPICRDDLAGLCLITMTGLAGLIGVGVGLIVMAYVFRLGWEWGVWGFVLLLVVGEIVVQSGVVGLVWIAAVIPGVAAAVTFERPDRETRRTVVWMRRIGLAVVLVQFVVWFIALLL